MRILLIAVDKLRQPFFQDACALYVRRLRPYYTIATAEVKAAVGGGAASTEAESILKRAAGSLLWAVDGSGRQLSSHDFAAKISAAEAAGTTSLALAVGGARGLHPSVIARADFRWCLSALTFPHEMARLIVWEQLYRAAKINHGEPYHR
ncbi:MAG: 23S rRNA (pseudouridine(1915)-N(3))-methyltransferase RlmH [Candidatus Eremiobacteraeota bacterium]|nr:23S rRNA (pseudouridine(1915)-N(3))-methyltransferase RlmH [Candidatus Eremiobacteraeota bacterium]MBC5827701.1 23S rRNA (pseudouridine(1915)-N(3))-methyltransferase RlmH [Candidatus Eremiobacteraeota bacterium]